MTRCRHLFAPATSLLLLVCLCGSAAVGQEIVIVGPNVCTRLTPYTSEILANNTEPIDKRDNTTVLKELKSRRECCQGYALSRDGPVYNCRPVCEVPCEDGICVSPNTCQSADDPERRRTALKAPSRNTSTCAAGRSGLKCLSQSAADNRTDALKMPCVCEHGVGHKYSKFGKCVCEVGSTDFASEDNNNTVGCWCTNGGTCDYQRRKCSCPPGYTGIACEKICDRGTWGLNCVNVCDCPERIIECNHITGQCHCSPGHYGELCKKECPDGKYGVNCLNTCTCSENEVCDKRNGHCVLTKRKLKKYNGLDLNYISNEICNKACDCIKNNTVSCNRCTGTCKCAAGWMGPKCSEPCSSNMFGENCKQKCRCLNNATCSPTVGTCICAPGYYGYTCSQFCPEGKYGDKCSKQCQCDGFDCDAITGECRCGPGLGGVDCKTPCKQGFYGRNCTLKCNCNAKNTLSCDPFTGKCNCRVDWNGVQCDTKCKDHNVYGRYCKKECTCINGTCRQLDGRCVCNRGWFGLKCHLPCSPGTYGYGCKEKCKNFCNHVTGENDVRRSNYLFIEKSKPDGTANFPVQKSGVDSRKTCDYKFGERDRVAGRNCDQSTEGYAGYDRLSADSDVTGDSEAYSATKNSSLTMTCGLFVISLLIVLIMATVYYRQRVLTLETVIARVRYEISPLVLNSDLKTSNIFTARTSIAMSDVYQICEE